MAQNKTTQSILKDMAINHNLKYVDCEYGDDSKLRTINEIDASLANEVHISRAMYSTTLFKLLGLKKLFPSSTSKVAVDVCEALKNMDVSKAKVFDPSTSQRVNVEGASGWLSRKGYPTEWKTFLKSALTSQNGDIGNAKVTIDNDVTSVTIPISNRTHNTAKIVAQVLSQNNNLTIGVTNGSHITFDDPSEVVSELPNILDGFITQYITATRNVTWEFPSDLETRISDGGYNCLNILFVPFYASWPATALVPSYTDFPQGYWPFIIFSTQPLTQEPVVVPRADVAVVTDSTGKISLRFAHPANIMYFGMSAFYGNVSYNETEYLSTWQTPIVETDVSEWNDKEYTFASSTIENQTQTAHSSVGMPRGCVWQMENDYGASNEEISWGNGSIGPSPSGDIYDVLKYRLTEAFNNAGYGINENYTMTWSLNADTASFFETNDLKYLTVGCVLSNNTPAGVLPIVIVTSKPINNAVISTGSNNCTVSFNVENNDTCNVAIMCDSQYFRSASAWKVGESADVTVDSVQWNGDTTIAVATGTYSITKYVNSSAYNRGTATWTYGAMANRTGSVLNYNIDLTATGGNIYQNIADALLNDTLKLPGSITFSDDNIDGVFDGTDEIADIAENVNAYPPDGEYSLIDDTQTYDDVIDTIKDKNDDSGVNQNVATPTRYIGDTNINYFSQLYKISSSELAELANFVYSSDWMDKAARLLGGNPLSGIISIMAFPFEADGTIASTIRISGTSAVYNDHNIIGTKVTNYKKTIHLGDIVLNNLNISEPNFSSYSPYTHAYIYLPFFGMQRIDFDTILSFLNEGGNPKLSLDYRAELITGSCAITMTLSNDYGVNFVILQTSAMIGLTIPLTSGTFPTIAGEIMNSVTGALKGSLAGPTGVAAGALSGMFQNTGEQHTVGGIAGNTGFSCSIDPYIVLTTHDLAPYYSDVTFKNQRGLVSKSCVKIRNLKDSYVELESFDLSSLGATKEEKDMLSEILRGGFWTDTSAT